MVRRWGSVVDGVGVLLLGALAQGRRRRGGGCGVVHVIDSLGTGGGQRQFLDLARHRREWTYLSLTDVGGTYDGEIDREGLKILRLYRGFRKHLATHALAYLFPSTVALWGLYRFFRRARPACVWGWTFLADVVAAPAARLAGVPRVVVRVENLSAWKCWPPHRRWWNRRADGRVAALADVVVANAPAVLDDYARWAGAERARMVVLPNAVDAPRWLARPWRSRRQELGIGAEEVVVLTVGRLSREKNQALLLGASVRLKRAGVGHRVVVVGEGELREALERLRDELGLARWVHFVGVCDTPQDYYRSADLFVLSSDIEGLPNAVLEAQVFGLPVVTTGVAGAADVVRDGETGLVVRCNDEEALAAALRRLIENPQLRRRLGEAAQARVCREHAVGDWVRRVEALSRGEWAEVGH